MVQAGAFVGVCTPPGPPARAVSLQLGDLRQTDRGRVCSRDALAMRDARRCTPLSW